MIEVALIVALISIVTIAGIRKVSKGVKCSAYLTACSLSTVKQSGYYTCNPGPIEINNVSAEALLTDVRWYCQNSPAF